MCAHKLNFLFSLHFFSVSLVALKCCTFFSSFLFLFVDNPPTHVYILILLLNSNHRSYAYVYKFLRVTLCVLRWMAASPRVEAKVKPGEFQRMGWYACHCQTKENRCLHMLPSVCVSHNISMLLLSSTL